MRKSIIASSEVSQTHRNCLHQILFLKLNVSQGINKYNIFVKTQRTSKQCGSEQRHETLNSQNGKLVND